MVTLEKEEIQQAVNKANLDADKEYQSKIASLSLTELVYFDTWGQFDSFEMENLAKDYRNKSIIKVI